MPQFLELKKSITRRYTLAVLIIAVLSTGAFYALKSALSDSDSTAFIVNISGNQRMLSQHIALDVHRIYKSLQNHLSNEYIPASEHLRKIANEMSDANKRLSTGLLSESLSLSVSDELKQMYFGEMNLAQRVQNYTDVALSILRTRNQEKAFQIVQQIDLLSEPLFNDLDAVVNQYQKEVEERLALIETLELIVWLVTLMALVLEVIFIFRPMAQKVVVASEAEKEALDSLQNLIELRTIKLETANQKLMKMATHDPLTNLKNRMTLEADIEKLIEEYQAHQQPFALVMMDIDWFKKVNDNYGHSAGDSVLKELALILKSSVRSGDKVYRSGGEEFVILLNRISDEEILNKLEKIRLMIESHVFEYEKISISLTASFGVFHSSHHFSVDNVHRILKLADVALYQSKSLGRNRVTVAEPDMGSLVNKPEVRKSKLQFKYPDLRQLSSADDQLEELTGYAAQTLREGKSKFLDLVYKPDQDMLEVLKRGVQTHGYICITIRLLTKQNKVKIFQLEAKQEQTTVDVFLQEATELAKSFEDELLVHNFHVMMENTSDFIYFKDRGHVYTAASKTLVEVASVSSTEELVGKTDYDVFSRELSDEYFALEKQVLSGQVQVAQDFHPTNKKTGELGWIVNRKYPIKDEQGKIIGLFGIARIISESEYLKLASEVKNLQSD